MTQRARALRPVVWRWLAALLLLVTGVWAGRPAAADEPAALDQSLLLMLASQNHLYGSTGDPSGAATADAAGDPRPLSEQANEHRQLAQIYDSWSWDLDKAALGDHFADRAAEHEAKAKALDQARQRAYARGKGLQLFLRRRVVRPIGQAIGWTARGVVRGGRVVLVFVRQEIAAQASQMVRARLADVRNLLQGRIDAVWHRVAAKIGMPLAELIRQLVVDPAFVRLRDQVANRTGAGQAIANLEGRRQDSQESDVPDDEPDLYGDVPYNEEGDTDYGEDEPAGADGIYDIRSWFSEETVVADCAALMGEHAHDAANMLDFFKNSVDGGDGLVIRVQCDYRTEPDLVGASLDLEVFSEDRFVEQARGAGWWESYCGSGAREYTNGELFCEANGQYIEKRNCTSSDCAGCDPSKCDTFITFTDGNAWATILMTLPAEGQQDRVAMARALAERVRQVLAAKRRAEQP